MEKKTLIKNLISDFKKLKNFDRKGYEELGKKLFYHYQIIYYKNK